MTTSLAVNLRDLLHARTVESERIEFKASWHPETTGHQVIRTTLRAADRHDDADDILERAWAEDPLSPALAVEVIGLRAGRGEIDEVESVLEKFEAAGSPAGTLRVANAVARALIQQGDWEAYCRVKLTLALRAQDSGDAVGFDELVSDIRRMLIRADEPGMRPSQQAALWGAVGKALEDASRPTEEVTAAYERAASIDPGLTRWPTAVADARRKRDS